MEIIVLLNGMSVGVFGMILSAAFCDIYWSKRRKIIMAFGMAWVLLVQGIVMYFFGSEWVQYLYPIITHLPLMIILGCFCENRFWVAAAVLTAYLCCQLRRWTALLIVAVFTRESDLQAVVEILITLPILILLIRKIAPSVREISLNDAWIQYQFAAIPVIYYVFDYFTNVYLGTFLVETPVIAEFMSFICCMTYLVFVIYFSREKVLRTQMELIQESLNIQVYQSIREIEALRTSQQKAQEYRHDLRHHLSYLLSCIENGKLQRAQNYIQEICAEIESTKVNTFCENEAANLIFSSFANRAEKQEILFHVQACIPHEIHVAESDLCVLLSNALENALFACQKVDKNRTIKIAAFIKNEKLFLELKNTCGYEIVFENGLPVTTRKGHGIGVQSICAFVQKYEGIYAFAIEDNEFVLRISV